MTKEFVLALIFGVVFGTFLGGMDAFFFLVAEEELTAFLKKDIRNRNVLNLVEGSISTCVSLLIATYIETLIHVRTIKHPVLDCIGVLIGTALVCLGYYMYLQFEGKKATPGHTP